eukprot:6190901-Pleurochrysis_carterae.AAC.2
MPSAAMACRALRRLHSRRQGCVLAAAVCAAFTGSMLLHLSLLSTEQMRGEPPGFQESVTASSQSSNPDVLLEPTRPSSEPQNQRKSTSSIDVDTGLNDSRMTTDNVTAWCENARLQYNVVPGTSWGSLPDADQDVWTELDCNRRDVILIHAQKQVALMAGALASLAYHSRDMPASRTVATWCRADPRCRPTLPFFCVCCLH